MKIFSTPQWEVNPVADKTCNELFKSKKQKKKKTKNKLEVQEGRIKKKKSGANLKLKKKIPIIKNNESKHNLSKKKLKQIETVTYKSDKNSKPDTLKNKFKKKQKAKLTLSNKSSEHQELHKYEDSSNKQHKSKNKITHQTLFSGISRKSRSKLQKNKVNDVTERIKSKEKTRKEQFKANVQVNNKKKSRKSGKLVNDKVTPIEKTVYTTLSRKQMAALPLRERMLEKLKAARFRYLNEQMYTTVGKDAKRYFDSDPDAYTAYHEGYRQQVARWPLNPVDVIIKNIKNLPKTNVIADFGCGEAKLAKSVPHTVHSFDLKAINENVTECDMANVPLENNSVDVVVFCLSLMGTNLKDYIREACRVLKIGGVLKIAEVESRFDSVEAFIKNIHNFGFTLRKKDFSHNLFCFLDFVKKELNSKQKKLPDISLNPCLYKKR